MSMVAKHAPSESSVRLHPSWLQVLGVEFDKPYMKSLKSFLQAEKAAGKVIFPTGSEIFQAFNTTPFDKVKVVILGQDPYHGPGQAHGLCFSVRKGVELPPSLKNIFQEIEADMGMPEPTHGELTNWAEQGVLLLNTTLTVEQFKAASHQGRGWETFTDAAIQVLNDRLEHLVFMLWGSSAQKKASMLNHDKHLVLKAPHPSPLSAYRGFLGCRHFSKANAYLKSHGVSPIDWRI